LKARKQDTRLSPEGGTSRYKRQKETDHDGSILTQGFPEGIWEVQTGKKNSVGKGRGKVGAEVGGSNLERMLEMSTIQC